MLHALVFGFFGFRLRGSGFGLRVSDFMPTVSGALVSHGLVSSDRTRIFWSKGDQFHFPWTDESRSIREQSPSLLQYTFFVWGFFCKMHNLVHNLSFLWILL